MLRTSRRVARLRAAGIASPALEEAERLLHEGQCNCAYWHGAFGGVYLNHLRTALYEAATTILRMPRRSALRAWAYRLAERSGVRKARVALARKLGVVLHRMWASGSVFRWEATVTA